jgi:hypothetical protein
MTLEALTPDILWVRLLGWNYWSTPIPNHGSGHVQFGSGHVRLSGRKSWPPPDPSHLRVWSGFGFLVIIFELSWVGPGYFLSFGENFDPCPTRRTVGSGRVGFFWVVRVGFIELGSPWLGISTPHPSQLGRVGFEFFICNFQVESNLGWEIFSRFSENFDFLYLFCDDFQKINGRIKIFEKCTSSVVPHDGRHLSPHPTTLM